MATPGALLATREAGNERARGSHELILGPEALRQTFRTPQHGPGGRDLFGLGQMDRRRGGRRHARPAMLGCQGVMMLGEIPERLGRHGMVARPGLRQAQPLRVSEVGEGQTCSSMIS